MPDISSITISDGNTYDIKDAVARYELDNLATVATSGSYNDLTNKPELATSSTNGLMSATDKAKLDAANTSASGNRLARIVENQQITISKSAGSPAPLFISERSDLGLRAGFGINSTDSTTPNVGIYQNNNGTGTWLLAWQGGQISSFSGFRNYMLDTYPKAVAYLGANQTLSSSGTITKLNLNAFNYRSDTSLFSFSNNGIVMPYAGRVLILGSVRYTNYNNVNGCYIKHGTGWSSSTEDAGVYLTGNNPTIWKVLNVAADDIIWLAGRSGTKNATVEALTGDGAYATSLGVFYLTRS